MKQMKDRKSIKKMMGQMKKMDPEELKKLQNSMK